MASSPEVVPRNVRAEFRNRLAAFAEQHQELNAPDVSALFARTLPDSERDLVEAFIFAEAHNILAWEMRAQFSKNRSTIFASLDIGNPDRKPVNELPERQRQTLYERISQWQEYLPSLNRTVALMTMTRPALIESAQFDAKNVAYYGRKMLLKKRLANGLPDDMTPVASFYTPESVATLIESINAEMNHGNFRLAIKPVPPLSRPTAVSRQDHGRHSEGPGVDRRVAAE